MYLSRRVLKYPDNPPLESGIMKAGMIMDGNYLEGEVNNGKEMDGSENMNEE